MKIKQLLCLAFFALTASVSQAELKSFEASNINSYNHYLYPGLDLNGLDNIKIRVDQQIDPNQPMPVIDVKRIEFNFPNANNLVATQFTKVPGTTDTYRSILTSPWVFKKVLIELVSFDFFDQARFNYRVMVVENNSNINNLELAQGIELFAGDAMLVNKTPNKVVDVVRTRYLDKALTLRLYDQASMDNIKIQAIWMGHGTEVLNLPATVFPDQKPVAIVLDTVFDDQRIKVRLDDAYYGPETPDQSLRALLEQAFGPLPYPEQPLP